jgi:poly(3-hydroxybutyrate) depolymerase
MKSLLRILLFCFSATACLLTTVSAEQDEVILCDTSPDAMTSRLGVDIPQTCIQVKEDGRIRCFYTYTPACAEGPTAVVFDLHGVGSCTYLVAVQNDWIGKANEECFIVIFPVVSVDLPFC